MRRAIAIALLLAGCGGGSKPAPTATASPAATAVALQQPIDRCGSPAMKARLVRMRTSDGVTLDGAEVGSGPHGAVFLHESGTDLCNWWPFAKDLADGGVHALMIDQRCVGASDCPNGAPAIDAAADVAAAVAELRRQGATRVVVVGASLGGANALVAASVLGAKVDGVASLSGEPNLRPQLDVPKVIGRLRAPLLLAVAHGDGYVSIPETRAMLRRAGSKDKRMIVRPITAGHGTEMLFGVDAITPTALFGTLVKFIRSV